MTTQPSLPKVKAIRRNKGLSSRFNFVYSSIGETLNER